MKTIIVQIICMCLFRNYNAINIKTAEFQLLGECRQNGALLRIVENVTATGCAVIALNENKTSIHFVRGSNKILGQCNINDKSNSSMASVTIKNCLDFQVKKEDPTMDFTNACNPNPCLYSGKCKLIAASNNFSCQCFYPAGGKTCKDLICNNCTRLNDLVIFLFNNESLYWDVTRDRCIAMGYQLHMPKTEVIFNFTRSYLQQMYANYPLLNDVYRVGMRRASVKDKKWMWVDGTELGSYQPWAPGRPKDDKLCLNLINTKTYDFFSWSDDNCDIAGTPYKFRYYYICEKRFSIFL